MHIAICDDNMADRYQLERLLKRESDKRSSSTGILYTDAFGNCDALLSNPMRYDVYFIDICKTEGITGVDVVTKLAEAGIYAPVVLCCSDINYREYTLPDNVSFLNKPFSADALSASIDYALQKSIPAKPLIELREDNNTYYVTESDFLYAVEEGRYVIVSLADGNKVKVFTDIPNLTRHLNDNTTFLTPTSKIIVNAHHIANIVKNKIVMTDGTVFKAHRSAIKAIIRLL